MAGRERSLSYAIAAIAVVLVLGAVADLALPWKLDLQATPLVASLAAALAAFAALAGSRRVRAQGDKLSEELDGLGARLLGIESRLSSLEEARSRPGTALAEMMEDVRGLSVLVRTLAETLSAQEREIDRIRSGADPRIREDADTAEEPPRTDYVEPRSERASVPSFLPGSQLARAKVPDARGANLARSSEERLLVAVDAGAVDLHVQPIVSLPQRRVRIYEVFAVLRLSESDVLVPDEFIPTLERLGHVASLDAIVVQKALAFRRRLAAMGAGQPVSCSIAAGTLRDPSFVETMSELVTAYPREARELILDVTDRAWSEFGPTRDTLAELSRRGVALCVNGLAGLDVDGAALAKRGARYVKVASSRLLDGAGEPHASRLATSLAHQSIQAVAGQVEDERIVPELIELGVPLAQGFAFAFPSPVEDVLADRNARGGDGKLPLASELRSVLDRQPAEGGEDFKSFLRRAG